MFFFQGFFKTKNLKRRLLEEELEAVGIRLNKRVPNIYYKPKKAGGLTITATVPLTKIDEKLVHSILAEYSKRERFMLRIRPTKKCYYF